MISIVDICVLWENLEVINLLFETPPPLHVCGTSKFCSTGNNKQSVTQIHKKQHNVDLQGVAAWAH